MTDPALQAVLDRFAEAKILVLGELWLEHAVRGEATQRANGELLVRALHRVSSAGGAGGVSSAATAMGAKTWLAGIVGQDARAGELLRALGAAAVDPFGIVSAPGCETGEKLVLTIDDSAASPCSRIEVELAPGPPLAGRPAQDMLDHIGALVGQLSAVVMVAYGAPTETETLEALARLARSHNKLLIGGVMSDREAGEGRTRESPLPQCDLLLVAAGTVADDEGTGDAARDLLAKGGHAAVLVGRADGSVQLCRAGASEIESFPNAALTGCGVWQAVVAGAAVATAAGADPVTAARIGIGASIVASRSGDPPTAAAIGRELNGER